MGAARLEIGGKNGKNMQTGIIGLPQTGKTTLFNLLTGRTQPEGRREDRVGIAAIPDRRLERLAHHYQPRKATPATLELIDLAALTPAALRAGTGIQALREVDALVHVIRAFGEDNRPAAEEIRELEFDLIFNDLTQIEKRRDRVQLDLKKQKSPALEQEAALLARLQAQLEAEKPLRELELTAEEEKRLRGFQFLSRKPILYVLNLDEAEAAEMGHALERHQIQLLLEAKPRTRGLALCALLEAEIASLPEPERLEFLAGYGLQEPGLVRLARVVYDLLGLISFFTAGEDECRAWTITRGTRALDAAGVIHTDLAHHFIRAEVIDWQRLLEAGSEAAARERGWLRLEGKDYIVQDGDVMHIRHSG